MAGLTLAQAEAQLLSWLDAATAVARNQGYSIDGRTLTRADADHIRKMIEFWDAQAKRLARGGPRVRGAVPVMDR